MVLFRGLLDDAAIFPPGNAPMSTAVRSHLAWQASTWSAVLGPLICPDTRWDELLADLPDGGRLAISMTLPGGVGSLPDALERAATETRTTLLSLEIPSPAEGLGRLLELVTEHVPADTRTYVELPWPDVGRSSIDTLARAGVRLKLRTGGTDAAAFPDERRLATAIQASVAAGVPFKLTAGLHDPIRHRDPHTGFEHHGYLNVIWATAQAVSGHDLAHITAALAERNPSRVAEAVAGIDVSTATRARQQFRSFGTCSIADPVTGLRDLGLLDLGLLDLGLIKEDQWPIG
ncbi:hypothetical protein M6D93_11580 [Jatrophihabitans telluris]|uniref:Uncharacterized protein n=1 Tax=Jatrophihabitans telluris TaxID=2038343 RepID=A0ABY4QV69_9ACTN|nr:hypothetical protein [Jatrophihabitans telluris]UQX86946.1 hypothetical protein M6D93_11580 [Jatrophihabitans telluris]